MKWCNLVYSIASKYVIIKYMLILEMLLFQIKGGIQTYRLFLVTFLLFPSQIQSEKPLLIYVEKKLKNGYKKAIVTRIFSQSLMILLTSAISYASRKTI